MLLPNTPLGTDFQHRTPGTEDKSKMRLHHIKGFCPGQKSTEGTESPWEGGNLKTTHLVRGDIIKEQPLKLIACKDTTQCEVRTGPEQASQRKLWARLTGLGSCSTPTVIQETHA